MKINTLLAQVEHKASQVAEMFSNYLNFFSKSQGAFQGVKKTFIPRDGYGDEPTKRGNTMVVTTVREKYDWMSEQLKEYLNSVFIVEACNSSNNNRVELIVDGIDFGYLSAPELMRLKNFLTRDDLLNVLKKTPVRSDSEVWEECTDKSYEGREIVQSPMQAGITRTTETEDVILQDPNLDPQNLPGNYKAAITTRKRIVETGDYTYQKFSGEWTQLQKANLLKRRSQLLEAVLVALKEVNSAEIQDSNLDTDALIDYLFQ